MRETGFHSTPNRAAPDFVVCTKEVHRISWGLNWTAGRRIKSNRRIRNRKKGKAQLSRARISIRGAKWGQSPLDFRLNPVQLHRGPIALPGGQRPIHVPPSLGAQYQGLWKTCQEKIAMKPQNVRQKLSKASIRSGASAKSPLLLSSQKNFARAIRFATLKLNFSNQCGVLRAAKRNAARFQAWPNSRR